MFDGERGYLGITDEITSGAEVFQKFEDFLRVTRPWLEHLHGSLTQPGTNVTDCFLAGQGILECARIGADTHKAEQYYVQEADRLGPGQAALPPRRRFGVKRGLRIVGVEEQVDVGDDHFRWRCLVFAEKASTSKSSAN